MHVRLELIFILYKFLFCFFVSKTALEFLVDYYQVRKKSWFIYVLSSFYTYKRHNNLSNCIT